MNQRVVAVKNNNAIGWMALWAAALLLSAVALFIGFGTRQASASGATSYTVKDLGTLGGPGSSPSDINDNGQVVGYSDSNADYPHAFLYENGQMQDLDAFGGRSWAQSINNQGQIVGGFRHPDDLDTSRAFLYENGQMRDLGNLLGPTSDHPTNGSYALAINNNGQVVGNSDGFGGTHAFLYGNGQMQDLGSLSGTAFSTAYGINDSGQVVGYANTGTGSQHAFLYENGQMQDLGTLGGQSSNAFDINNNGQVVGSAAPSSGSQHAFLYKNGQMQDLGTLGGPGSGAEAINDSGQVVGFSNTGSGSQHAFLYENGQMKDLNSLIPQDSGWALEYAIGINKGGQIVGRGMINGESHAFLLTPPTASSVDSASQSVAAGGTVSTATADGTASSSDPLNTSITTPVAGTVTINETSVSQPETSGFSFFGQQVNIDAPQASVQNPLSLKFVIDSSVLGSAGVDYNSMQLFRDGVRIEPCDAGASSTTASPDPCIKQRAQLSDGDASITVLSSHASAWNLGIAKAGTPLYSFKGFLQPVDNLPTVNTVKAGSAVPVKFSLGGDKGLDVFAAGYPRSGTTPSDPSASMDAIEQTLTASTSGLSYSTTTGQYTYTWKTDKAWAGQTRQLVVRYKDGTEHKATFKLTK